MNYFYTQHMKKIRFYDLKAQPEYMELHLVN